MNKQYEELRVVEGEYIPQPAMEYPQENPFERTLFPVFDREMDIDEFLTMSTIGELAAAAGVVD